MEKLAENNIEILHPAIKILPIELTRDLNLKNYFYKFGAYPFIMDQTKCTTLHIIFKKKGLKDGLEKYSIEENKLHRALTINGKIYLGYDGYGIHQGTRTSNWLKNTKEDNNNNKDGKVETERFRERYRNTRRNDKT